MFGGGLGGGGGTSKTYMLLILGHPQIVERPLAVLSITTLLNT